MSNNKVLILPIFFYFLLLCKISFSQSGWIPQNSNTKVNLNSVKFINENTGFCIGEFGQILKTINKGNNWISLNSGYKNNFNSLSFSNNLNVYIAGDSGLLIKTTDLGISWYQCNLNKPSVKFNSVNFVNDTVGFLGGIKSQTQLPNKIFKTYDGGISWDSIEIVGSYSITLFFINSEIGWSIIGYDAFGVYSLFKTINGGMNWIHQFSSGTTPPAKDVFFIDSSYGWLSYRTSFFIPTILRSIDGGNNWITESPGTGFSINSLYFTDRRNGWAAGDNNVIQATTNGGINWINQTPLQPGINYNSVYFTDSLTGWVVGDSGTILKTTTGGVLTGFSNTSTEIPDKFFLSQNYPNPFNPETVISYELRVTGRAKLIVYDVLGNEIATLVNETKPAGNYNYQFSTDNYQLSSGVYLYRLEIDGNIIETKRMVLLK